MTYGMPYTGSKNGIAEDIIKILPPGKRFVDLFGGGGAMTHCAVLSGKYECVLYNEILPLVADTFQKAINGYYAPENFKPWWVSREDFFRLRETDGYVALCFSFGNNMENYFCGEDMESKKRELFNAGKYKGETGNQAATALARLARLARLADKCPVEVRCEDYTEYEYREGDVVYCDPPYITQHTKQRLYRQDQSKRKKAFQFEYADFYDWAATRDYPVYVSSYAVPDLRFDRIAEISKRAIFAQSGNGTRKHELLFTQKRYAPERVIESSEQITLA